MAMKRTTVDGRTLNQRTADMLALWQFNALKDFYVVQGSYNKGGVGASAGTHDGGGALDLSVYGWSDEFTRFVVKQGRLAGFAAYYRAPLPGVWGEHIHAIAVGDPELSSGARAQVKNYYDGDNALASHRPDTGPQVTKKVYPNVVLKKVSLLALKRQFAKKKPTESLSVARVQWVLNEKTRAGLTPDGIAGPKTKAAYKAYAKKFGKKSDVPTRGVLRNLGAGRFTVATATYDKWVKEQAKKKAQQVHEARNSTFN